MYTLLYSIMCLSNATKNQKDVFSRHMQSYVSNFLKNLNSFLVAKLVGDEHSLASGRWVKRYIEARGSELP